MKVTKENNKIWIVFFFLLKYLKKFFLNARFFFTMELSLITLINFHMHSKFLQIKYFKKLSFTNLLTFLNNLSE